MQCRSTVVRKRIERSTHICGPHHPTDLLHGVQIRAQAAMHGKDLFIDDGSNGQTVEAIRECLPQLDVVPPLAFVIKPIDTVDRGTLMIPTKDEEVLGILDLVCKQEADCLKRLLASVDIISEEEVVGFRWKPAVLEQTQKIVVLAVNITAYLSIRYCLVRYFIRH
jgi:hypothetical protein